MPYDTWNWARSEEWPMTGVGADPDLAGWIYVAVNTRDATCCKVGRTKRRLYVRTTETTNPFYAIHVAYHVEASDTVRLESWIHYELSKRYLHHYHLITNKPSEWFQCAPHEAERVIEECLRRYFHCPQDDQGWLLENDPVELRRFRPHYNPMQLSERLRDNLEDHPYWKYLFPRLGW
ncbi:GIY-YIG nuclease family protein [Azohydromonas caseinilytica]|uniref:GIY-YIG nuclease family protein n=1 Tax=Azohydromonas caseinilytica TaxID=2728836 RepID=A0A848FLD9_9BURK|nr:GIY-YIG nuclease family protein [Azohydromonas caseinilytica]NML19070.1 GIY-YIG nuclease family protein [Azohydromonas caseinilytica]